MTVVNVSILLLILFLHFIAILLFIIWEVWKQRKWELEREVTYQKWARHHERRYRKQGKRLPDESKEFYG